jgi:hypothetical protein
MWSVGCIFAELLIGRALFRGQSEQVWVFSVACFPSLSAAGPGVRFSRIGPGR